LFVFGTLREMEDRRRVVSAAGEWCFWRVMESPDAGTGGGGAEIISPEKMDPIVLLFSFF
jgi:hypothetical protein